VSGPTYGRHTVTRLRAKTKGNINLVFIAGVLKTPVRLVCGRDPCVGKLCPVDPQARCFTDYQCKSTFWNLDNKEEITECKGRVDSLVLSLFS
jgi:hypothetical protein